MTFHNVGSIKVQGTQVKARAARWILACALTAAALLTSSCDLIEGPNPILLEGAQIKIGSDTTTGSSHVSIHYTVSNASSKDITTLHISFYMYDTSGNPAPVGKSNYFDITFSSTFAPGSQITGATNLDSAFWYLPQVDLIANQFHIYKVEFGDGSSWTDWLGQYVYPYSVTSTQ